MDHVSDAVRPIVATTSRAIRPVIPDIVARTISCAVVAVVALPALSIAGAPVHGSALQLFLAVAISAVAFLAAAALALGRIAALVGLVVVAVSAWLLAMKLRLSPRARARATKRRTGRDDGMRILNLLLGYPVLDR